MLHDGALGDVLLSLPLFRHLRERHPDICLAARPDIGNFFRQLGLVDDARDIGSILFLSLQEESPDDLLRMFLRQFDRAYVFSSDKAAKTAQGIRQIIRQTVLIHTIPPDTLKKHAAAYRMGQLGDPVAAPPTLPEILKAHRLQARDLLAAKGIADTSAFISIHPGSGSKRKNWPLGRYFELAEKLLDAALGPVVFLSGPAESDTDRQAILRFAGPKQNTVHCEGLRLLELAALLAQTQLYIGNDSGATHLAASAGASVIALFGPTDPGIWAPPGPCVQVIRATDSSLDSIPLEQVFTAALSTLSKKSGNP